MTLRVAINGFGRIGRLVFRVLAKDPRFEVVLLNDLSDAPTLAHLLRFDSTHGRYGGKVEVREGALVVDGRPIRITAEKDPANLPHRAEKVDWVVESTGVFTKRPDLEKHLAAGAGKVLLTVPPKDKEGVDALVVMGANDDTVLPSHRILSNASCTTNCLAPLAKILHEAFEIERGLMTTIHAYTNDQRILDLVHKDLRRARSAAQNIIPTSTGAARAVGKVLPALAGKLDGTAVRVPVANGSLVDLVVLLKKPATTQDVNAAVRRAADGPMKRWVEYSTDPIVSTDVVGNPASCVFDSLSTMASGNMVKVFAWYDNEWGYSNRVVDLMAHASAGRSPRAGT